MFWNALHASNSCERSQYQLHFFPKFPQVQYDMGELNCPLQETKKSLQLHFNGIFRYHWGCIFLAQSTLSLFSPGDLYFFGVSNTELFLFLNTFSSSRATVGGFAVFLSHPGLLWFNISIFWIFHYSQGRRKWLFWDPRSHWIIMNSCWSFMWFSDLMELQANSSFWNNFGFWFPVITIQINDLGKQLLQNCLLRKRNLFS